VHPGEAQNRESARTLIPLLSTTDEPAEIVSELADALPQRACERRVDERKEAIMTTVTESLTREHLGYEVIPHRRTQTAREEADVLGISPEEVAKTVVMLTRSGFVRAVVPASKKVDVDAVRKLLVDPSASIAPEAELVLAYPMFELGAVPPFGGPGGDRILIDSSVLDREAVVLEAGSQRQSVRMRTADLSMLCAAEVASIATD
jgi:Ala-tRNA(Pro) deacylase